MRIVKSEWKVTSNLIGEHIKYAVFRLCDIQETDHSGNREFATDYMDSRDQAQKTANDLNLRAQLNGRAPDGI